MELWIVYKKKKKLKAIFILVIGEERGLVFIEHVRNNIWTN